MKPQKRPNKNSLFKWPLKNGLSKTAIFSTKTAKSAFLGKFHTCSRQKSIYGIFCIYTGFYGMSIYAFYQLKIHAKKGKNSKKNGKKSKNYMQNARNNIVRFQKLWRFFLNATFPIIMAPANFLKKAYF